MGIIEGSLHQPITSVVLANNTARDIDTTVPTGKGWLLLGIKVTNPDNVTRNVNFDVYKEAAKTNFIARLAITLNLAANAAGRLQWPNTHTADIDSCPAPHLVILGAGNTINAHWDANGVSAGGTDADGLVIEYLEVAV